MGVTTTVREWAQGLLSDYREWKAQRRQRRETGLHPQQRARDALADDFLWVLKLTDQRAASYDLDGTPLAHYGRNERLECVDDRVVECQYPGDTDTYAFPASRIRPLAFDRGEIVRDRFTGDTLKVRGFRTGLASDVEVDGTPLHRYGVNARLDCGTDWVVDCTYRRSNTEYAFPISRLVPQRFPTRPERWKDEVTTTRECYSCADGRKDRPEAAACPDCRARILARDDATCQQKGCEATEDLQIHHLHYEPDLTGMIPDRYLITLCRECHEQRHGIE